jgi:hypothetical protein
LIVGAITAFFAASVGLFQNDIKKVIAYSTMSQLAQECKYHSITFRLQTKYEKVNIYIINYIINVINSQITKAHDYKLNNHISYSLFNSSLNIWLNSYILSYIILFSLHFPTRRVGKSEKRKIIIIRKLVDISETIRLILILCGSKCELRIVNMQLAKNLFILYKYCMSYLLIFINMCGSTNLYLYSNNLEIDNIDTSIVSTEIVDKLDKSKNYEDLTFNQWLAGLIDGDGYFRISSCQITMDSRDVKALNGIKQKYGGTIRPVLNANAVRYILTNKKSLISLINDINGLIRNPKRLSQMNKLCVKYNIELKYPGPLNLCVSASARQLMGD